MARIKLASPCGVPTGPFIPLLAGRIATCLRSRAHIRKLAKHNSHSGAIKNDMDKDVKAPPPASH